MRVNSDASLRVARNVFERFDRSWTKMRQHARRENGLLIVNSQLAPGLTEEDREKQRLSLRLLSRISGKRGIVATWRPNLSCSKVHFGCQKADVALIRDKKCRPKQ